MLRGVHWRWVAFPGGVLLAMLVLVGLNLNGSSIALLSSDQPVPGLVTGTPRPIRSDEWRIRTPLALSGVRQGLPTHAWIGLSRTDQTAAAHGAPTLDWTTLLKPQDWGYVALGESRGLAVSWWASYAVGLIGCFALLGVLLRRPVVAALLSTAAVFTPYSGWWSAPPPALFLGYAALAGASLIAAWTVSRQWHAAALAVAAGVSGAALALALYPPWQVTLGLVVIAVCFGFAIDERIGWKQFLWPLATAGGTAGALLGLWAVQHQAAISAQTATAYPGHRISEPGTASISSLLDAPLNFWMNGTAGATLGTTGEVVGPMNLSEAASTWLPLPVAVLVLLGVVELVVRGRRRRMQPRGTVPVGATDHTPDGEPDSSWRTETATAGAPVWTLAFVSSALLLLLAWSLVDLPTFVGKITLLGRVPPTRTPLALGFALILLVALATKGSDRRPLAWTWPALAVGALATAVATVWTDQQLGWDEELTPAVLVLLSGLTIGAAFAGLMDRRVRFGAACVLATYAFANWVLINPLQQGIDPVSQDPLVQRLGRVARNEANLRVEVFVSPETSLAVVAKVRAAGLQSLTGTTFYPDAALMQALVPTQKDLWNNYAQYIWVAAPQHTTPLITQLRGTLMSLTVPVCDPVILAKAEPGWVVSDRKLDAPCLRRASVVKGPTHPRMWIYRVVS